jgi:pheromone shutdown protein TraB
MLMQRNRYYAEAIRRLIEIGNQNILVVTGSAHTDGTIKRLEDERIPASDRFRKHFFIISPDERQEKISIGSTD